MPQVTIYLDKSTEQKARAAAKRAGKSLSGWLRTVIELAPEGARIRGLLGAKGEPIGANDYLVAAIVAAEHGVLVTGNVREFRKVPGLKLENWITG